MSILSKIEEHAEHILQVMKELLQHQIQNFVGAAQHTQEVVDALEDHVETKKAEIVAEVKADVAPVVNDVATVVTEVQTDVTPTPAQ